MKGMELTNNNHYSMFITGSGYGVLNYPLVNPGGGAYFDNTDSITMFITKFSSVVCDTTTNTTSTASICETQTKNLIGTPAGGIWSVVNGGGSISGTTYTPANINNDTTVTIQYRVNAVGTCPADSTSVTFTVNVNDTATNTTSSVDICGGQTKTLVGSPAGGTWTIVSILPSGNITGTTFTANNVTMSTGVTIRYTVSGNGACPSSFADVTFNVQPVITPTISTSDSSLCQGITRPLVGAPTGGTWSILSGPGSITGTILNTTGTGTIQIEYNVTGGSCGSGRDTINIIVNPQPNADAGLDENICVGDTVILTATGGGTYQWIPGLTNSNQEVYPIITTGYRVDVTSDSGCVDSDSVTVFIQVSGTALAQDDQVTVISGGQELIDIHNNDVGDVTTISIINGPFNGSGIVSGASVNYQSNTSYIGADSVQYYLCDVNCQTVCDTAWLRILVESDLEIPTFISPNEDGLNDSWFIKGLDKYPNASTKIFNRWGSLVYEELPYQNDWEGTTRASLTGEKLPSGTYFYILNLGNDSDPLIGYLQLRR
jgi:gliding motility-associated-like protein